MSLADDFGAAVVLAEGVGACATVIGLFDGAGVCATAVVLFDGAVVFEDAASGAVAWAIRRCLPRRPLVSEGVFWVR